MPNDGGNRILAGLPPAELRRIEGELKTVALEMRQPLWQPNQRIDAVYFPVDAVVSILAETEAGAVEVGTIGNEGVVGLPVFLGADSFPGTALVQISGRAQQIDAEAFRRVSRDGRLRELLQKYTLGFLTQASQGTACNRAHSTEQRLARWLLVLRATVSETAATLQERGLIKYSRGTLTIINPRRLEKVSCECYQIVRDEFQRLLGISRG